MNTKRANIERRNNRLKSKPKNSLAPIYTVCAYVLRQEKSSLQFFY